MLTRFVILLLLITATAALGADVDTDGDGLPDFQERYKYFTNPQVADSDQDGVADGDWHERREYAYSIRTVVKVMRPCDPAVANDDYQDARVLSEASNYVELEVIHYPFNANASALDGSAEWSSPNSDLKRYLQAGITTNWDDEMRRDLIAKLQGDGIVLSGRTDKEIVQNVSSWLLKRGSYRYMFGTYFVHFPDGKAKILDGLEDAFRREQGNTDLPFEQHVQREVFGKGMYENKCYGTCTSTAVYLTTALRAIGIPTRMVLAIPVVDGTDPLQVKLIEDHISHHQVRRTLLRDQPRSGFAAHTFNEVYVGGRWRRLNYNALGQNNYGPGAMGMLTHVLTFTDLSEAGLTQTWGKRYGLGDRDATFQAGNPYRTTEVSDRFGIHSTLQNTPFKEPQVATVSKAYWFFSDQRPSWIPAESVRQNADGHLLLHVDLQYDDLQTLYPKLDSAFTLESPGQPQIEARAERGFWNEECYVRIAEDQFKLMVPDVPYQLKPVKSDAKYRWKIEDHLRIVKPKS